MNGEPKPARVPVQLSLDPRENRTHSEFKDDCDINVMISKVRRGLPVAVRQGKPLYGDFTNVGDYLEALSKLHEAQDAFMQLPASARRAFNNDPAVLISAYDQAEAGDQAVRTRLEELGLLTPPPPTPPPVSEAIPPAPPPAPAGSESG